jgi:hypothetical protein
LQIVSSSGKSVWRSLFIPVLFMVSDAGPNGQMGRELYGLCSKAPMSREVADKTRTSMGTFQWRLRIIKINCLIWNLNSQSLANTLLYLNFYSLNC